jgi:hypothetical protein
MDDNQNNRNDPSPSASDEGFLNGDQRSAYNYTVSANVIELLSCKRRAELGADRAAELGCLPI